MNAEIIKYCLLCYYRFKRNMACADEVSFYWGRADVLCDNGKATYEIEVKTNKHDLFVNEMKKGFWGKKHDNYRDLNPKRLPPNYFILCVPVEMWDIGLEWIEKVNPKYGLIVFDNEKYLRMPKYYGWAMRAADCTRIVRSAKKLHKEYRSKKENILKRLSSAYIFNLSKERERLDKSR